MRATNAYTPASLPLVGLILSMFLLAEPAAAALSCRAQYAKLEEIVSRKFATGLDPAHPGALALSLSRKQGNDHLAAASRLWTEYWPDEELLGKLRAARGKGSVSATTLADLKLARARLKVIRFLCDAICTDDSLARHLDEVTKTVGKLEEAQAAADPARVEKALGRTLDAFGNKSQRKLREELEGMRSARRAETDGRLAAASRLLEKAAGPAKLTEEDIHDVRKALGRVQTLLLFRGIREESEMNLREFGWLRRVYDQIGDGRDEGALISEGADLALPKDIRARLREIVKALD